MASDRHCGQLADRIREVLKKGIALEENVMHYIDSTHAAPTAQALHQMLTDPADSQDAALPELVFSPGESIQLQIEEMLAEKGFQSADQAKVAACLLARPVETEVFPLDRRFTLKLNLPESVIEGFVSQLNIGQPMDGRLTAAVRRFLDRRLHGAVNLRLRNRRFKLTGNIVDFLCTLIEKRGPGADDFMACFEFMLGVFEETPAIDDIYERLLEKKRFYFKALQASALFLEHREKSNMETLLLQGVRIPHIDPVDIENRMGLVDRITRAVYNKTETYEGRETAVSYSTYDNNRGTYP